MTLVVSAHTVITACVICAVCLGSGVNSESDTSPSIGFENLPAGFSRPQEQLNIHGSIPKWLSGSFYSNGPGYWKEGDHWFVGQSFLKVFTFSNGVVSFMARFTNTSEFHRVPRPTAEPIKQSADGASPATSMPQSVNTQIGVLRIDDSLVLTTTYTSVSEVCPVTGETLQAQFLFDDDIPNTLPCASIRQVDASGNIYNFHYVLGEMPGYKLYRIAKSTRKRVALGPVLPSRSDAQLPFFVNSFGLTENYIVVPETPSLVDADFSGTFLKDLGTRWYVLNRTTGGLVKTFDSPAFFCFHVLNAYEDEDAQGNAEIVIDLPTYPDIDILLALKIDLLRGDSPDAMNAVSDSETHRYRLSLSSTRTSDSAQTQVYGQVLSKPTIEIPTIDYERFNSRKYRFAYGLSSTDGQSIFLDKIVKLDMGAAILQENGARSVVWSGTNLYPSEPMFVPRTSDGDEDDGVLLSIVLDAAAKHSFLLVLDAPSFAELARVPIDFAIPIGFHARFFRSGTFKPLSIKSDPKTTPNHVEL